jgi:hypothetical protein
MFWFYEGISPAVLYQRNASNTAWNRIIDTADVAASRLAIGAMVQPQTPAGLGQVTAAYVDQNTVFAAPAGGAWWGTWLRRNKTTLGITGHGAGVYAGGGGIFTTVSNEDAFGDFIRIV